MTISNLPIIVGSNSDLQQGGFAVKDAISLKSSNIASSGTTDLSTSTGDFVDVSGTTTITALGTMPAGVERVVRFTGTLTLTHNATSLILPGAANITTANGDIVRFRSLGAGNWVCTGYMVAANAPGIAASSGPTSIFCEY